MPLEKYCRFSIALKNKQIKDNKNSKGKMFEHRPDSTLFLATLQRETLKEKEIAEDRDEIVQIR